MSTHARKKDPRTFQEQVLDEAKKCREAGDLLGAVYYGERAASCVACASWETFRGSAAGLPWVLRTARERVLRGGHGPEADELLAHACVALLGCARGTDVDALVADVPGYVLRRAAARAKHHELGGGPRKAAWQAAYHALVLRASRTP